MAVLKISVTHKILPSGESLRCRHSTCHFAHKRAFRRSTELKFSILISTLEFYVTQSDKAFARAFGGVLAILVIITIGVAIAANSIPNPVRDARDSDPRLTKLTDDRIAPFAQVNTGEPIIAAAAPAHGGSAGASAEPRGGEDVYNLACGACHGAGVMGAPKLGDKAVVRLFVQLVRWGKLLDASVVKHGNAVRHGQGFGLVVGHVNYGNPQFVRQIGDLELQRLAQLFVQCAQRLVHQNKFGFKHKRTRQRDPLLLTAGQL